MSTETKYTSEKLLLLYSPEQPEILYSLPSCEKTLRLKLLWLSAIVTSPAPLMPTPIG